MLTGYWSHRIATALWRIACSEISGCTKLMRVTTTALVGVNELVDCFVTDLQAAFLFQAMCGLLRAEVLPD